MFATSIDLPILKNCEIVPEWKQSIDVFFHDGKIYNNNKEVDIDQLIKFSSEIMDSLNLYNFRSIELLAHIDSSETLKSLSPFFHQLYNISPFVYIKTNSMEDSCAFQLTLPLPEEMLKRMRDRMDDYVTLIITEKEGIQFNQKAISKNKLHVIIDSLIQEHQKIVVKFEQKITFSNLLNLLDTYICVLNRYQNDMAIEKFGMDMLELEMNQKWEERDEILKYYRRRILIDYDNFF